MPRSVMVGFVNSTVILIFLAQVPHMIDVPWLVYPMIAAGIAIMVLLPKLTKAVPARMVPIVVLTIVTVGMAVAYPRSATKVNSPTACPPCYPERASGPLRPLRSSPLADLATPNYP